MNTIGLWQVVGESPARLSHADVRVERDLEDWIERDPALLERGLVIVGRQLRLEGGPLDLLALDPQGRWVLIEIKRERLRREVIAQALDYASCLHRLEPARLREQCDAYLRSKGERDSLDALLEQRGSSLGPESRGRDIVIYFVGTGYDPGVERMVAFLEEQAELSLRIVTFSAFRDETGNMLLAREIHESAEERTGPERQPSAPSPSPQAVLALADQNGVGAVVRTLYDAAVELGMNTRPYAKSVMFTPPANRARCLFVVWVERRQREPGVAKGYIAAEAFEQFYGIKEEDLVAAVGQVGYVLLDQSGANRLRDGLRRLMTANDAT